MAFLRRLARTLATLSMLAVGGTAAEEYWEGYDALDRGDYRAAFKIYSRLAEAGDARAQDDLGFMYYLGHGTRQDFRMAAKWFRAAAEQGHAPAQINLGTLYRRGLGVSKDNVEAHRWFALSSVLATSAERRALAAGYRDDLSRHMTIGEIGKARTIACSWWRRFRPPAGRNITEFPGCMSDSR
tara:strand:+ start:455 stop:1006 length:552 start_codon:yes stop_codon:yes gene_type:complete